jgi:Tfp pilus assembly protein PilV
MKYFLSQHSKIKNLKGLTLLETLVAILVISLTIIGPLSFLATSSSYAKQTREAIVATYLAEEAAELLQNRYDALYVQCVKQPAVIPCTPDFGESTSGQIAWRLFKERMSARDGHPSCFIDDNPSKCAFDAKHMEVAAITTPERYVSTGATCKRLISATTGGVTTYVCSGIPSRLVGASKGLVYERSVYLEHLPTFEATVRNEQDHDDIRIVVSVKYRAVNGTEREVKISRYLHPRP